MKRLFLVDGLGALLSSIMLGVVLVEWEHLFGMPVRILYFLAAIAAVFAIYSLTCFWQFPKQWPTFLKGIAIANLLYCALTLGLVIYHHQIMSLLGEIYFILEILIVSTLAFIEWKTAAQKPILPLDSER